MAIIKGAINFGSNFNIGAKGPIDARQKVQFIADLTTAWTEEIPAYKDMTVACEEDHNIYILTADDATKAKNWKIIGDVSGDITNLQEQITANKTAIDKINGTGDGSFAKGDADTLTTAKKYTDDAKAELLGETGGSGNTIISAKEDAAAAKAAADNASKKVDTEIGKLDGGGTSPAVKGVTVTVNEADGIVATPSVSIADGTLTGAATDDNLVTGTVVKTYVDGEITKVNTAAGTLSGRVDTLEGKVGSKAVEGGAAATGLFKEIADEASTARAAEKKNADAISAEASRADAAEKVNAKAISDEITRATAAEEKVKTDLIGTAESASSSDTITGAKKYADEQIAKSVTSVYKVKGTKATYENLPSEGNVEGDVWNVVTAHGNTPAGTNYVWVAAVGEVAAHWDPLGGTIDLSPYETKEDASKTYATKTELSTTKSELIGVDGDTSASDTIKGAKKYTDALETKLTNAAVTLTIPKDDPYITASREGNTNKYTISSKLDTDGTTPLVDVKINAKLTEKINSLDVTGNTSEVVKGVTVTVNETDGKVITPVVSIADGTIGGASDTNLVTGGTVKTYVDTAITNAALVWNDIPATA